MKMNRFHTYGDLQYRNQGNPAGEDGAKMLESFSHGSQDLPGDDLRYPGS
jgi:hypothetical protein